MSFIQIVKLPKNFIENLINQPETGMGYQIANIILHNGDQYNQVVILECSMITQIRGLDYIPFSTNDIKEIIITHEKWKFN